jgi:metallo-beta-lactamase class B
MRSGAVALLSAVFAAGLAIHVAGQSSTDAVDAHIAAAKTAAGQYHTGLFNSLCSPTSIRPAAAPQRGQTPTAAQASRPAPPELATWHAEPVKVFDNLFYVGEKEYSAWAVNTSDGIIIIDTIFDYSVEDEVVGGLKKLGLDPAQIKYVIVSHGHGDHSGGAKFLQSTYKARVLMSEADWDLLSRNPNQAQPTRDMVVTDGMKLTLGDTTLTLFLTPGHTPGTISTLIPVKDNGRQHLMAEWGGTAFNFTVTPDKNREYWFKTYIASAEKFREAAQKAGADGIIANHTNFDGSKRNFPLLANRKPGDPNPFVKGTEAVMRYLTVAEECAKAALAELQGR